MHDTITSNTSRKKMNIQDFDESLILTRRFVAIEEHLFSEMKGEAVILSLKNGKYYGVNAVGSYIWNAVQTPNTLQGIKAVVMDEFEVDEATCHREIISFLKKMAEEELIKVLDEKNS